MKPFQTKRQQLKILRDRGMEISNGSKALRILERESYYSLVNGYKDIFLEKDQSGKNLEPEKYKLDVTFEEVYSLYLLDRELRNTLIEYLLKFESDIKTKIAYRFSEKHKENHAYLMLNNYSRDPKKLKNVLGLISNLSKTISSKGYKKNAIGHYLDKHDGVPLWVLVNFLSMGNMQYFYHSLTDSLQNEIARDFSVSYKRDYNSRVHFTSEMIESILQISAFFRNVCAHEERLYSFRLYKPVKTSGISSAINIPNLGLTGQDLFSLLASLKLVLPKSEHKILVRKFTKLFGEYSPKFQSVNFNDILLEMGFNQGWENQLS